MRQVGKKESSVVHSLLRHEREQRGWSQAKVAELVGSTPDNISRWERGITMPSPHFHEQLCTLFKKDAQALGFIVKASIEKQPILDPFIPIRVFPHLDSLDEKLSSTC